MYEGIMSIYFKNNRTQEQRKDKKSSTRTECYSKPNHNPVQISGSAAGQMATKESNDDKFDRKFQTSISFQFRA
jgi:hypothetical protein